MDHRSGDVENRRGVQEVIGDKFGDPKTRPRQAAVIAVLTATMALAMLPPFALGALGPYLVEDLGVPRAALGTAVGATYAAAALLSPTLGRLVDSRRARSSLAALLACSSAAFAALSLAPDFTWLVGLATLGGIAAAASNPVTNKLVASVISERRRGLVMGVKASGVQVGAVLAGLLLPVAAGAFGWRAALQLVAAASLGLLITGLWVLPAGRQRHKEKRGPRPSLPGPVLRLAAYTFFVGGGLSAAIAYLPLYADEALGLDGAVGGAVLSALGAGGLLSRPVWGYLSDRTGRVGAVLVGLAGAAVFSALLIWGAGANGTWALWAGALGLGASASAWNAVALLAAVKEAGPDLAGYASGVVSSGFFAGFVLGPPAFGLALGAAGAYGIGWALVGGQFALAAAVVLARPQSKPRPSPHVSGSDR